MEIEIPANTRAIVYVPATGADVIKISPLTSSESQLIGVGHRENDYIVFKMGSGKYHFEISK